MRTLPNRDRRLLTLTMLMNVLIGCLVASNDELLLGGFRPFVWAIFLSALICLGFLLSMINGVMKKRSRKVSSFRRTISPPLNAEFLFFLFLERKTCEALVGDLEEGYRLLHKKFGKFKADLWYWKQVTFSLGPLAWAALMKVARKLAIPVLGWLVANQLVKEPWAVQLLDLIKRLT